MNNYKKNSHKDRTLQFLYQNELLKYDFKTETDTQEQHFLNLEEYCFQIVHKLIELQTIPMTRKDNEKCHQSYNLIIRLTKSLEDYSNQFDEIIQGINSAISESETSIEEFVDLIRQYVYSDISPIILVQLLHLIDSMMAYSKSFYINLFDVQFIDYLLSMVENPDNGIKKIFLTDDEEDENDIYAYSNNIFLKLEFNDTDKCQARMFSCEILSNIFKIYFNMNEEEEEEEEGFKIEIPPLQDIVNYIIGGIENASESNSFQYVISLLMIIVKKIDQKLYDIGQELFITLVTSLIKCAKNLHIIRIDLVLGLLSYFNYYGFIKDIDIYSQKDFDEIFITSLEYGYDYHWALLAFIHSVFFSGNQGAVEMIMESLNNSRESNFIGFLESRSEEYKDLSFCKFCRDLLHLIFMDDNEYSISEKDFITFFDSIGLIDLLAKIANDADFNLRRQAVLVLSATCYNYDIDIMKKLIVDYNFIENFTPFVALDLSMFDASIYITYKILTIIQTLSEIDARALFERLVSASILDELRNTVDQFNLPDPLAANDQDEDKRKLRMSNELLMVFNLEKEIGSLLFQNADST